MSTPRSRKAAIQDYKNRMPARGAYAVRCSAPARVWVGASPNLDAARNGLWFMLRTGACRDRDLQCAWDVAGEEAFEFSVLERLDDDVPAMRVADLLKACKTRWAIDLGAAPLL